LQDVVLIYISNTFEICLVQYEPCDFHADKHPHGKYEIFTRDKLCEVLLLFDDFFYYVRFEGRYVIVVSALSKMWRNIAVAYYYLVSSV